MIFRTRRALSGDMNESWIDLLHCSIRPIFPVHAFPSAMSAIRCMNMPLVGLAADSGTLTLYANELTMTFRTKNQEAMAILDSAKNWARRIKRDVVAVYFAARNPETPWAVRVLALAVAAYALSPIDLIPDFIPVLGYLDDLLIVPFGLWLVIRLLPAHVLASSRAKAVVALERPRSNVAAIAIVGVWLLCAAAGIYWLT